MDALGQHAPAEKDHANPFSINKSTAVIVQRRAMDQQSRLRLTPITAY